MRIVTRSNRSRPVGDDQGRSTVAWADGLGQGQILLDAWMPEAVCTIDNTALLLNGERSARRAGLGKRRERLCVSAGPQQGGLWRVSAKDIISRQDASQARCGALNIQVVLA